MQPELVNPLLEAVDIGLVLVDADLRVAFVNRWISQRVASGVAPVGQPMAQALGEAVEPRLVQAIEAALRHGQSKRLSHAFHPTPLPLFAPGAEAGSSRLRQGVDVIAQPTAADGSRRCLVQVRDMTESARREQQLKDQARQLAVELARVNQAQAELERQSLRFSELARLAPVGLLEIDVGGAVHYANERALGMLRRSSDQVLGQGWMDQLPPCSRAEVASRWLVCEAAGERFSAELELPGEGAAASTWLRVEGCPIGDLRQGCLGHILTITDVTELREHAKHHEHRANHDALTGVANRERLSAALNLAIASGDSRVAVLFIDLDRFKPVNDLHGHAAGDAVLKAVADRLVQRSRAHDIVGRLGGDEFALVLRHAPDDETLQRLVARLAEVVALPIAYGKLSLSVGASIGVAIYPDHGGDAKALLDHADQAMYDRKAQRKGHASREVAALVARA